MLKPNIRTKQHMVVHERMSKMPSEWQPATAGADGRVLVLPASSVSASAKMSPGHQHSLALSAGEVVMSDTQNVTTCCCFGQVGGQMQLQLSMPSSNQHCNAGNYSPLVAPLAAMPVSAGSYVLMLPAQAQQLSSPCLQGTARMEARVQKDSYYPGEVVSLMLDVSVWGTPDLLRPCCGTIPHLH
jgi:hypothetical protein